MNDDDDPLDDLFASFREVEPPAIVRAGNRVVVHAALREAAAPRVTNDWLQRSVATPLPAALATAALLLVSLTLNVVLWRGWSAPAQAEVPGDGPGAASPVGENRLPSSTSLAIREPVVEYSETQRYLSGVGVVDRQVSYAIKRLP
jgi:hypothetical protein